MKITDHGDWVRYVPKNNPLAQIAQPHTILFCQRVSDKRDWYEYQRDELHDIGTIKATLSQVDGEWTVQTTSRDPSFLFPADHKLIEIDDTDAAVEHESLRRMRFNPKTRAFDPALPWPVMQWALSAALEGWGLQWPDATSKADAPVKFSPDLARKLNMDEVRLKNLFEAARKL